jgi:hypothetical protein
MVRVRAAEVEPADVEMTMDIGVYWAAVRIIRGQQRVGDGVAGILDDKGKPIRQGVWSRWVNVREQVGLGSHENTVSFRLNSRPPITRVKGEVEVAWGSLPGQVVRRYVQDSEGPAFGILLPNQYVRTRDDVVEGVWPAGYLKWISSISEKSEGHIKTILAMPFPAGGTPKLYSFFTGVAGYGGCHYSKAIQANELRCAALLGINAPFYLSPQNLKFAQEQGLAESLVPRTMSGSAGGPPSKACVSDPANEARIRRTSADYLESVRQTMPEAVNTTWIMKNGDEIGFAAGPEHIEQCESCVALFRRYLSERGLTPAEMGASDWSQVRPAYNLSPAGKAARRLHYFTTLFLS